MGHGTMLWARCGAARGGGPATAREVGDQALEVTDGDRGVREPDALLELIIREAAEQRVLAQESDHALAFSVRCAELGVRHRASVGAARRECKSARGVTGQVSG